MRREKKRQRREGERDQDAETRGQRMQERQK